MIKPSKVQGLRHVALKVRDLEACTRFYTEVIGMQVEWQPDIDNVYLTSGTDNLALHRTQEALLGEGQRLDHIGFILTTPQAVDDWYPFLVEQGVKILTLPKTHRDGARSLYCQDPDGNAVQFIYHPPLADFA